MRKLHDEEPSWDDDDEPEYIDLCQVLERIDLMAAAMESDELFDDEGDDE